MVGYAIIFGIALASRLLVTILPVAFVSAGQQAIWSWRFFAVFAVCFFCALVFAVRSKLPTPAEALDRPRSALALPLAVGAAVALLTIWSDVVAPAGQARGLTTLHVTGWVAIPFYAYGAIVLTTAFHFLPMAFVAWLAQRLRGAIRFALLCVGVVAVGLSEDTGYFLRTDSPMSVDGARHVLSVAANCAEALFIYRFGLLSGLAQRSATYFLWHLVWPLLGQS